MLLGIETKIPHPYTHPPSYVYVHTHSKFNHVPLDKLRHAVSMVIEQDSTPPPAADNITNNNKPKLTRGTTNPHTHTYTCTWHLCSVYVYFQNITVTPLLFSLSLTHTHALITCHSSISVSYENTILPLEKSRHKSVESCSMSSTTAHKLEINGLSVNGDTEGDRLKPRPLRCVCVCAVCMCVNYLTIKFFFLQVHM